jgi:hypothetical protein
MVGAVWFVLVVLGYFIHRADRAAKVGAVEGN